MDIATSNALILPTNNQVAIEAKAKLDVKLSLLSPEETKKVMEVKNSLDANDRNSISKFASEVTGMTNSITDRILQEVTASSLNDIVGVRLNDMVAVAKKVNIEGLRNASGTKGIVGRLMKVFPFLYTTKEKVMAQFSTAATQIQKINDEISNISGKTKQNITTLEQLGTVAVQQFNMLDGMVLAGQIKLSEMREETERDRQQYANVPKEDIDPMKVSEIQRKIDNIDILDNKLTALAQVQQAIYINIPQLESQIKGCVMTVNRFETLKDTMIPLWKQSFTQAIMIDDQRRAAELDKEATDFTQRLLKENATNMKIANIEIAKSSARGLIDVETLEHMQKELVEQVKAMNDIYKESSQKNLALVNRVESMRLEFKTALDGANV